MTLANEVSTMETELISLRSEIDILRKHQGVLEFENESLHSQLAKMSAERDHYLRRTESIKTLLDQTGSSLVSGIKSFHDSERSLMEQMHELGGQETKYLSNGKSTN